MNILITGGSSGLGKSTVELLASDKTHNIYFTYNRRKDDAIALTTVFPNTRAIVSDFTNVRHIDNLLKDMDTMDLDVLINNAYVGAPRTTHFCKIDANNFVTSFQNNLLPIIRISQKALIIFKRKKFGKIINILTSYLLNLPPIGFSEYIGNKAYLQALSKVWNKEYAQYNITSNCIAPEYMQTNFAEVDERIVEQMQLEHPLKKLLTPKEVAEVIRFLVQASQQVNGVTIPVNAAKSVI
jgi:NAD(P)-dependent dehydrogenase (short-subunit alcohol dehydrogenase family)